MHQLNLLFSQAAEKRKRLLQILNLDPGLSKERDGMTKESSVVLDFLFSLDWANIHLCSARWICTVHT